MLRFLCREARIRLAVTVTLCVVCCAPTSANPALEGYANQQQLAAAIAELERSDLVSVSSLGKSLSGREITLLTIAAGEAHQKPGIAIVGNVQSAHLVGGELAVRIARQLVAKADGEEATKKLLERFAFYIIPRPDPDGAEKCFGRPFREPAGNARRTDDDRDFEFGEDPPEDLNEIGRAHV